MLEEAGFRMALYDPFFAPDDRVLTAKYDFVTCTETAEHFFEPRRELETLDSLLMPGGWLALMTEILEPGLTLSSWRYARDPTHVCFYSPATLKWVSSWLEWKPEYPDSIRGVVFFQKAM